MNTRESAAIRVLLVSCEQKTMENVFDVMHQLGMYVEVCSDSATAARQLCNSKYEGVVVDPRMGEEGLELLNNLRDFTSNKGAIPCAIYRQDQQKSCSGGLYGSVGAGDSPPRGHCPGRMYINKPSAANTATK